MREHVPAGRGPLYLAVGLGAVVALGSLAMPGSRAVLGMLAASVAVVALFNPKIALYLVIPAMALSPDLPLHGVAVRIEA